jgi:ABC transporter ATM
MIRTKFRKEANAADNKGATLAVDSLINFEAVKVSSSTSTASKTMAHAHSKGFQQ